MKPSLRRDSLEKAARKWAYAYFSNFEPGMDFYSPSLLQETLVRFATRHGAKVRRETQKPFVEYLNGYLQGHSPGSYDGDACVRCESIREFLKRTLTPRGPEKGRRAK